MPNLFQAHSQNKVPFARPWVRMRAWGVVGLIFLSVDTGSLGLLHPGIANLPRCVHLTPQRGYAASRPSTAWNNWHRRHRFHPRSWVCSAREGSEERQAKVTLEDAVNRAVAQGGGWPFILAQDEFNIEVWRRHASYFFV
jgi:hypothetical protein